MLHRLASLAQGGLLHCTALTAAVLSTLCAPAAAQQVEPVPGGATFAIYLGGNQVGREQWTLAKTDSGWVVTSSGRIAAPLDYTLNRFEMKYARDWQPLEMTLEARVRNTGITIRTSFTLTTAINEILQNNATNGKQDQISARTIVMPNNVFASYEALAVRLWTSPVDAELPVYIAPTAEIKVKVRNITPQTISGPG